MLQQTNESSSVDLPTGEGLEANLQDVDRTIQEPSDEPFTNGWAEPLSGSAPPSVGYPPQLPGLGSAYTPWMNPMSSGLQPDNFMNVPASDGRDMAQATHQLNYGLLVGPHHTGIGMSPASHLQPISQGDDALPAPPRPALSNVTDTRHRMGRSTNAPNQQTASMNEHVLAGTKRRFEEAMEPTQMSFPENKFARMASSASGTARAGMGLSFSPLFHAKPTVPQLDDLAARSGATQRRRRVNRKGNVSSQGAAVTIGGRPVRSTHHLYSEVHQATPRPSMAPGRPVVEHETVNAETVLQDSTAAASRTSEPFSDNFATASSVPQAPMMLHMPGDRIVNDDADGGSAAGLCMSQESPTASTTMKRKVRDDEDHEPETSKRRKREVAVPKTRAATSAPQQMSLTDTESNLVAHSDPELPSSINEVDDNEAALATRLQTEIAKMDKDARAISRREHHTGLDAIATVLSHSALIDLYHPDVRSFFRILLNWTPSKAVHAFLDNHIPSHNTGLYLFPKAINALRVTKEVMKFMEKTPHKDATAETNSTILERSNKERGYGTKFVSVNVQDFNSVEDAETYYTDSFLLI